MSTDAKKLIAAALKARKNAYAPYSGFSVGAALETADGEIYTGCNIESSSFTPTCCAERTAFCKAVSEGKREFSAIAVVGGERDAAELPFCPPCGVCRQFMREFCGEEFRIFLGKGGEASGFAVKEYLLKELLPCSFGGELFKEMRKDK